MDFLNFLALAFIGALIVQVITFVYALLSRRVDSIDIAWGLSFIAAIGMMQVVYPSPALWVVVADILVTIWGLRLSWHIFRRFRRSSKQDERYTTIMQSWPKHFMSLQLFVKLFLVQAILATVISLPVVAIHHYQPDTSMVAMLGLLVWVVGFLFESTADRQLKNFLLTPNHGDLMTDGLWRYSRHPNYFGEVTMWWGIALIALQTPYWFFGIVGATAITVLICFVSGIPLAEKRSKPKKGWTEYVRRTSPLLPWPPKK